MAENTLRFGDEVVLVFDEGGIISAEGCDEPLRYFAELPLRLFVFQL
jgi:hypothetical protein